MVHLFIPIDISFFEKDHCCVLIVSGTPGMIRGLDEGRIASAKTFSSDADTCKLYVMTKKEFQEIWT